MMMHSGSSIKSNVQEVLTQRLELSSKDFHTRPKDNIKKYQPN